jgi:hypothetical protein
MMKRARRASMVNAICLAMFGGLQGACGNRRCAEVYDRSTSTDGKFEMLVCRTPSAGMPGQSGDAPGFIRLLDKRSGSILNEADLEMVQVYPGVEWTKDTAHIKLIADWPLPK